MATHSNILLSKIRYHYYQQDSFHHFRFQVPTTVPRHGPLHYQMSSGISKGDVIMQKEYTFCGEILGFPGGSDRKNMPARWETRVQSLGQEDPLEEGMTTHCSILAWRIPWTEDRGGLQPMGSQSVWHYWETNGTFYGLSDETHVKWKRKAK